MWPSLHGKSPTSCITLDRWYRTCSSACKVRKFQKFRKGASDDLRATILNKPQMTLAETIEAGRSLETIGKHRKTLTLSPQLEVVNKVSNTANRSKNNAGGRCYRCGRSGHFAKDDSCPALNHKCERCGFVGHFKKRCNTKRRKRELKVKPRRKVVTDSDDSDDSTLQSGSDSEEESVKYLFATEPVARLFVRLEVSA
ncbi:uncharacterized protein LOC119770671 [Culex quinquefasciatus]|uniref:uncharacterized protein LOC119770671 n=1 Tax=Culex quinquefasciatus TaxID=7176 RepID=UPI0018E3D300|nr:uncharacterized protein LOC119770671 [Culex quinquefasciatus]